MDACAPAFGPPHWLVAVLTQATAVHGEGFFFFLAKVFFLAKFSCVKVFSFSFEKSVPLLPCTVNSLQTFIGTRVSNLPIVISAVAGLAACRTAGFSRIYEPCRSEEKRRAILPLPRILAVSIRILVDIPALISINYHGAGGATEDSGVKKKRYKKISVKIFTRLGFFFSPSPVRA